MPSRAVAYSPDGSKIAVGFGTPIRENSKQFDGKWIVLQEDDFQVNHFSLHHTQTFQRGANPSGVDICLDTYRVLHVP